MKRELDIIFVGGGLASALLAWRLRRFRPHVQFLILEKSEKFPTNKTWTFFASDLSPSQLDWLYPVIEKSWAGFSVHFSDFARDFSETRCFSIHSREFFRKVRLEEFVRFSSEVISVSDRGVYLKDGTFLSAKCVLDARGFNPVSEKVVGYQKFISMDIRLQHAHGLEKPILMDARFPQYDGLRFISILPWEEKQILVRDTCFSKNAEFSPERVRADIREYVAKRGWQIVDESISEKAVLPLPTESWRRVQEFTAPTLGMRGGFFHYALGNSLPIAAELAERISQSKEFPPQEIRGILRDVERRLRRQRDFFLFLNRMLFRAATPEERLRIFSRFYRLSEPLIQRFYAQNLRRIDPLRFFIGPASLSLRRAVEVLRKDHH